MKNLLASHAFSNLNTVKSEASSARSVNATLSELVSSEHNAVISSEVDEVKTFPLYMQSGTNVGTAAWFQATSALKT